MTASSASRPLVTRRERIQALLVVMGALVCFLILASFFTARLTVPRDGTQVIFPMSGLVGEGLLVRPLVPTPGGLQPFVLAIPVSTAIAILQENLFDINLILNRTLVYVTLTAILAALIAASTAFSQKFFVGLTGAQSDAAILLTTLFIVALFTPIKERLQRFVDKHFKEVPDPLKELLAYRAQTQSVLQVTDREAVARKTLEVAVRAFNAEGRNLFGQRIRQANLYRRQVAMRGRVLACLALSDQRHGEDYTDQDRATLLENLDLSKRALVLTQHANHG